MNLKKLAKKDPRFRDLDDISLQNWFEEKRDLKLCALCKDDIRGICCYTSFLIDLPSKWVCQEQCTDYLRDICTFNRQKLSKKRKLVNIILSKHPCKFLDPKTKLCTVYDNRFWKNRSCLEIHDARKGNALPAECVYLKGRLKKKYAKNMPKIKYENINVELCKYIKMSYELANTSPHEGVHGLKKY